MPRESRKREQLFAGKLACEHGPCTMQRRPVRPPPPRSQQPLTAAPPPCSSDAFAAQGLYNLTLTEADAVVDSEGIDHIVEAMRNHGENAVRARGSHCRQLLEGTDAPPPFSSEVAADC